VTRGGLGSDTKPLPPTSDPAQPFSEMTTQVSVSTYSSSVQQGGESRQDLVA
jgi:hypothetical protein